MVVKAEKVGKDGKTYRIVDDCPTWGIYAIERKDESAGEYSWWTQVYPVSGKCDSDYARIENEFNKF